MNGVDLSSFQNNAFKPGPKLKRALWYVVSMFVFQGYWMPLYGPKRFLLRLFGANIGKGLIIKPNVRIKYPWLLRVGEHCWIGEGVWIDNLVKVDIGGHVCISQEAMLLTGNHNYKRSTFDLMAKSITLENGAWIGARAMVGPGLKVGTHAVLTAGAVAHDDLEPWGIYSGVPATYVKKRSIE